MRKKIPISWNKVFGLTLLTMFLTGVIGLSGMLIVQDWKWIDFLIVELIVGVVPLPVWVIVSLPKGYFSKEGKMEDDTN